MLWLSLKDNQYQGCQFVLVTGPNIDLAKKLIKRMYNIIQKFNVIQRQTDYLLEINGCSIQAYPSHNLASFRSLDRVKFILGDECDFFPVGQQQEVRDVSERYIGKSDPWIVLVSTPNISGGLFEKIEQEKNSLYTKIYLPYTVGLNKIYTREEIEKAKQSPSFEREYNLRYNWGIGNVFLETDIQECISPNGHQYNGSSDISIGIDVGFGSSKFGICVLQLNNGRIEVLYAKEYSRQKYEDMLNLVGQLRFQYNPTKIYCDSANPEFIKSLKVRFSENPDYESVISQANKEGIDPEYRQFVIPFSFSQMGKELLGKLEHLVSKHWLSIPESCIELFN